MCEAVLTPAPRGRGEATLPFTERSRHRATKGSVRATTREGHSQDADPPPGSKCVDAASAVLRSVPAHPVDLVSPSPFYRWEGRGPWRLEPGPGAAAGAVAWVGAPRSFLRYLRPRGLGGSLSAPTDRNFCAVGSDGPISSLRPTAVVAAPYQTPNRPHLSPGREAREAPWALISQGPPCWR